MKTIHSIIAAAAVFVTSATVAESQSTKPGATNQAATVSLSAKDDRAIRKALAGYEAAWNSHNMKALGELFRADAEFINVVGMHWRGRADIVAAHAAFHETMFKDTRLKTDAIALRLLGADVAIAVVTYTQDGFTTPSGQVMPKTQTKLSYVFVKTASEWKIAHGQNVRIDAEAVQHDPVNRPRK
ncbi:MAG: SgcJ/EcaC family oxidoreductase [Verrucomicrobia bacterium]|nr:SgcJ/EcaC family oxidoreductase [Verrucomicrobiota bacterium]